MIDLAEGDRVKWISHENYAAGIVQFVDGNTVGVAFGPVIAMLSRDELRIPRLGEG